MSAERFTALIVGLTLIVPTGAIAQQESRLTPGDRVRLTAPALGLERFEGTLAAIEADSRMLEVQAEDTMVTLPIDSLTRLEVSRGKGSRAAGLVAGAALGALLGVVVGSTVGEDCPPEGLVPCADRGDTALIGGLLGGAIGAGLGYRLNGGTRWEPLSLQNLVVSFQPFRAYEPAVLASVRF